MNTLSIDTVTLESVLLGLLPAFLAAVAVQQLVELIDLLLVTPYLKERKALILKGSSVILGVSLAIGAIELSVLDPVVKGGLVAYWVNVFVTGLIISGGTESFNHILKYLYWIKQEKKTEADRNEAETKALRGARPERIEAAPSGQESSFAPLPVSNGSTEQAESR